MTDGVCDNCGAQENWGYQCWRCKAATKMKRSTTEDYPPLWPNVASALRDAAEAADAQLARDIEAARGVKPALQRQEGGDHYKGRAIQPIEYIHANGLGFIEGSIVKYITRWRDKGGQGDLLKIKHYVDLLIELEGTPEVNPAHDGWIDWFGGECPFLDGSIKVQYRLRTGEEVVFGRPVDDLEWDHFGGSGDIIAYRVV